MNRIPSMQICMMEWSDLRIVLAVEREHTLTAAARALGCDQSTVTRRLAAVQESLGARLFDRRDGTYVLTPLGERLRPFLVAVEENAQAVERAAHGQDASPRGAVRLTTIETLASLFLGPRLDAFHARYPDIELEIDVDHRARDLGRREADVALRLARPRQTQLVARKLGELGLALYAADAYLERRGRPRFGGSLEGHAVIADDETSSWSAEARFLAEKTKGARVVLRTRSWLTKLAAAKAGVGIAVLACFLADREPSLRRLEPKAERATREIWLIVHRDLQHVARVRALLDFVAEQIADDAPVLAGIKRR
jgi:DNA-binding transcriptional LysR family regulator